MTVVDTHVWVWFVDNPRRLSARARRTIDSAVETKTVCVSSISIWEIALLVLQGRLQLDREVAEWFADCERLQFVQFIPVDNAIASKSVYLPPPLHKDPADRIIVATALVLGAKLVTRDDRLLGYPHVESIW